MAVCQKHKLIRSLDQKLTVTTFTSPYFSDSALVFLESFLTLRRLFSHGVIFTRARVSLALLSLRKNGGLLVV